MALLPRFRWALWGACLLVGSFRGSTGWVFDLPTLGDRPRCHPTCEVEKDHHPKIFSPRRPGPGHHRPGFSSLSTGGSARRNMAPSKDDAPRRDGRRPPPRKTTLKTSKKTRTSTREESVVDADGTPSRSSKSSSSSSRKLSTAFPPTTTTGASRGPPRGEKSADLTKVGGPRKRTPLDPRSTTTTTTTSKQSRRVGPPTPEAPAESDLEDDTDRGPTRDDPWILARELGLLLSTPSSDPAVDALEPRVLGQIRVNEKQGPEAYAYVLEKPVGWAVLGGNPRSSSTVPPREAGRKQQLRISEQDGTVDILEYDEKDILQWLTPDELQEYQPLELSSSSSSTGSTDPMNDDNATADEDGAEDATISERLPDNWSHADLESDQALEMEESTAVEIASIDAHRAANLRRIAARRSSVGAKQARFAPSERPSLVSWLKKKMQTFEGSTMRGGNYWAAVAGATHVDDSGLVLLCPRQDAKNVFCDQTEYVAVVGNGGYLTFKNRAHPAVLAADPTQLKIEVISNLKKGREFDTIQTVKVTVAEVKSSCSDMVEICQKNCQDGIRGDPLANPLDRRAWRRLIHCDAMSVSSLVYDETMSVRCSDLPDDVAVLASRRNSLVFKQGSFLGRSQLRDNPVTTAYREINGAADGFPGWIVDRYDKWLLVQHDPRMPEGPLPSMSGHDETLGIYYLESNPDRSNMGADLRPRLVEGHPAPDMFTVLENDVCYQVSFKDLSTGIFLDQRPQRAWLTKNCCADTHILNCFAHTGAFSVAAAFAGASTVSIDLSRKWLDRLPLHLQANGIDFDQRHDCIYGDCFEWLERLAKRGEKFDIVIIDPPSSSVGSKKKRWSVKNDMHELVALAAGLVKGGGVLWTTTNCASIHPMKFARMCHKGLQDAGFSSVKLERIQPMPVDFQSVGWQPVKNLIWRFP